MPKEADNNTADNNSTAWSFMLSGERDPEKTIPNPEAIPEELMEKPDPDTLEEEYDPLAGSSFGALMEREKKVEEEGGLVQEDAADTKAGGDKKATATGTDPNKDAGTKEKDKSKEEKKPAVKVTFPDPKPPAKPATEAPAATTTTEAPKVDPDVAAAASKKTDDPDKSATKNFGLSDEDTQFISQLNDEEQSSVEFWQNAETVDPDKYKGHVKKQLQFIRDHRAKVEELEAEDPDLPFDENPKYLAWVKKNKPDVPPREVKRIERETLIREAEERAAKKSSAEINELREWKKQQELQTTVIPRITKQVEDFSSGLIDEYGKNDATKEMVDLYKEKLTELGGDKQAAFTELQKVYPDEANIIAEHAATGQTLVNTWLSIQEGLVKPDLENNNIHRALSERVITYEDDILNNPKLKEAQVREGKQFVPRDEFIAMTEAERAKHWTFSNKEIVQFIQTEVLNRSVRHVTQYRKQEEEKFQRMATKKGIKLTPQSAQPDNDGPRKTGAGSPKSAVVPAGDTTEKPSGEFDRFIKWDY